MGRHRQLVTMLSRVGRRRHMASLVVGPPYYSLCGSLMDQQLTDWHIRHMGSVPYPDCQHCAKLLGIPS